MSNLKLSNLSCERPQEHLDISKTQCSKITGGGGLYLVQLAIIINSPHATINQKANDIV